LGTVLIIGGYGAWSLIPVVIEADLEPSAKAVLSGLFGATPFLTKVVAIRVDGASRLQLPQAHRLSVGAPEVERPGLSRKASAAGRIASG
jgi:hypothetical protein